MCSREAQLRILYVCTANICRSVSAAQLLRDAAQSHPLGDLDIRSAGTDALPGYPGCSLAPALEGRNEAHRSQLLTGGLIDWADLILPAARDHRTTIVGVAPSARVRTFTIRQAGRIADALVDAGLVSAARDRAAHAGPGWADAFDLHDPRPDVDPLPASSKGRSAWLVAEMDLARGTAVLRAGPDPQPPTGRRRRFRFGRPAAEAGSGDHPDDILDPHVHGMGLHRATYEQLRNSTDSLVRLLADVNRGSL